VKKEQGRIVIKSYRRIVALSSKKLYTEEKSK